MHVKISDLDFESTCKGLGTAFTSEKLIDAIEGNSVIRIGPDTSD
jgi:hypothetical protein